MCIFCGGQCGGAGDFLISIGLPFLVLYFLRIKKALVRLKNRVFRKGHEIPAELIKCSCCDQPQQDYKALHSQSIDPKYLELLEFDSQATEAAEVYLQTTALSNHLNLINARVSGVKGWLLLLCLNLTIFIPASYLYQLNCVLHLFNSTRNKILFSIFKTLLVYNILTIAVMLFLAVFSFYAGLRLWHVKSRAVKTAKAFFIFQFLLILLISIIRPIMTSTIDTGWQVLSALLISLIPSLFQFGLGYLYLAKSSRVQNTYGGDEANISSLPSPQRKLAGQTEFA
jgi:hypothetical protein